MFGGLAKSLFGSSNDRYVKSLGTIVDKINGFEPALTALSDEQLAAQTVSGLFRARLRRKLLRAAQKLGALDAVFPEPETPFRPGFLLDQDDAAFLV